MVDDVELASVIARIAAQEHADPASDDLTVPLAVELADAQARIGELEAERDEALKDSDKWNDKYCDEAFYEVGGAPQLWSERALRSEAANARLVDALRRMVSEFEDYHYHGCPADTGGECDCFAGRALLPLARAALASSSPSDGPREMSAGESEPELDAGIDFALGQLCKTLGVDQRKVRWDAATETLEGDVCAVIGSILEQKFGEDWRALPLSTGEA